MYSLILIESGTYYDPSIKITGTGFTMHFLCSTPAPEDMPGWRVVEQNLAWKLEREKG
jgi:hypothetical protein